MSELPEITPKAVILGVTLSALLAGANAYLGLLAGMTVSASIPAAVTSMAVLRLFRKSNILENNIVQTAASAGESLAAGVIFTFPALILLGVWTDFDYWQTTIIAAAGGLLGVLFTIPLRRALIVERPLIFPEGVATAEVLKAGDRGGARDETTGGIRCLVTGAVLGAAFKLGGAGLGLWTQSIEVARRVGGSVVYAGTNLLPALVAVGFIVRLNIASLLFLGGAFNWFLAIPLYAAWHPWPEGIAPAERAWQIWSAETRYLGVGAMVVGGLWALVSLRTLLLDALSSSRVRRRGQKESEAAERDTPMSWVAVALVLSIVPLFFLFDSVIGSARVSLVMTLVMLVAGFLFTAVAAYMAGIVGSSNNPVSGVTIATLLLASSLLLVLLRGEGSAVGPAAAILIGAVVCCAAAIGGDNMQDLKAGHLLGATPYRQQIMQAIGVLAAAVVMAPVLTLLLNAYGIVEPVSPDRAPLPAPQATLMASVARGVFERDLPWAMILAGALAALVVIVIDSRLARRGSRVRAPVLAVAVGMYLPLELSVPMLAGGLIAETAERLGPSPDGRANGVLLAAGLITGEALCGIALAVPIVLSAGANPLDLGLAGGPLGWPGVVLLVGVMSLLLRSASPGGVLQR